MDQLEISQLTNAIQDFGIWVVFAYLYLNEKKAHKETREQYRDDLRDIAGIRQNLAQVQKIVKSQNPDLG